MIVQTVLRKSGNRDERQSGGGEKQLHVLQCLRSKYKITNWAKAIAYPHPH